MLIVVPIVAGIGNAIMAMPMLRRLKQAIPAARITVVAKTPAMGEPLRRMPEVDEVLPIGRGLAALRMLRSLRRRHFDVCLIPFPSNRWHYTAWAVACGAKRRVMHGYPVGYFSALGFIRADRLPALRGIHDVVQNLNLLGKLGIEEVEATPPQFVIDDTDRALATAALAQAAVVIHAGSARTILAQAKRWPTANYARLIERIEAEFGPRVLLLEGPDEAGVAADIVAQVRGAHPAVLRLSGSLGKAAAVLELCAAYCGSDSGLAHLAAAVGTPAVTLFAPADPDRVCPFGCRDLVVQPRGRTCTPCFLYPWRASRPQMACKAPLCINDIHIDDVMAALRRAMAVRSVAAGTAACGFANQKTMAADAS